jgi:hypothetical protein
MRETVEREIIIPIFTTNIQKDDKTYEIVIKIMNKCNRDHLFEKNIMIAIRDYIISTKISKHFLLIYFYSLYQRTTEILQLRTYNEPVENSLRDLIIKDYGHNLLDDYTFHNLLIQSLLSIGSYHNLTGYVHMDTHTGNFLYAKNSEHNPEGYYQYSFGDDETYYLKSCVYNVMIHDFELSNKIDIPVDKIKRFELFYKIDEEEAKFSIIRDYVVKHKQYTSIKINATISVDERDYLNKIKDKFVEIEFYVNGQQSVNLPRYGRCVMTGLDINHAPNGFAAYDDSSMVQTTLQMSFKEMDILTRDNINDKSNPRR